MTFINDYPTNLHPKEYFLHRVAPNFCSRLLPIGINILSYHHATAEEEINAEVTQTKKEV